MPNPAVNFGRYTASDITDLNTSIAARQRVYPVGSYVTRSSDNATMQIIAAGGPFTVVSTLSRLSGAAVADDSPVLVTGGSALGDVLSAVAVAGWAFTGVQWVRETAGVSADIAGATSSTYTRVSADQVAGVRVYPRVSGLSYRGAGFASATVAAPPAPTPNITVDFVVYGANPGGIAAAIKARKLGLTVEVLNEHPANRIMGMAMGIMHTDLDYTVQRGKGIVRGTADDLYKRVAAQYSGGTLTQQRFMNDSQYGCLPNYVKAAYEAMLSEQGITVRNDEWITSVQKTGTVITSVSTNKGNMYGANSFMDATYHGDLMDMAGLTTFIGRNSAAQYGETSAGVRPPNTVFPVAVSPYVTPGNPGSGLLPGIDASPVETTGAASGLVQVCTIRLTDRQDSPSFTRSPDSPVYNALDYELLRRSIIAKGTATLAQVFDLYALQNVAHFDVNNGSAPENAGVSLNYTGPEMTEYLTATRTRRAEIELKVKNWILGLIQFLRTDATIPVAIKNSAEAMRVMNVSIFGGDGFPANYYLRQGRTAVGDTSSAMPNGVLVESDARVSAPATRGAGAIAIVGYPGDRHWARRGIVADGSAVDGFRVYNEGGMALAHQPNGIPMQAIIPKASECSNLLLNFGGCFSAIYQGFVRMEPTMMMLGDAAGAMAAARKATGKTLQALTFSDIEQRHDYWDVWRVSAGGALVVAPGNEALVPAGIPGGTVTSTGTWSTASGTTGIDVKFAPAAGQLNATMRFAPNITDAGLYEVAVCYQQIDSSSRASAVQFVISHGAGPTTNTFTRNQNVGNRTAAAAQTLNHTGDWDVLGVSFQFAAGAPSTNWVEIRVPATGNVGVIGAVAFRRVG